MNILLLLLILNSIITGTVILVVTLRSVAEEGIENHSQEELTIICCTLILSYIAGIIFVIPAYLIIMSYDEKQDKNHKSLKDEK